MKFFITGERNSGKSYLVERVKALAKFTGFETRFDEDLVDLFISFFNGNSFLIGSRDNGRLKMVDEGFSSAVKLLGAIEIPSDHLLIMDEIGFLEEDSPEFQQAVVSALRRARHCLCVLRKGDFSFIGHLKSSMGIRSMELTPGNREQVFARIAREIERERALLPSPGGDEGI